MVGILFYWLKLVSEIGNFLKIVNPFPEIRTCLHTKSFPKYITQSIVVSQFLLFLSSNDFLPGFVKSLPIGGKLLLFPLIYMYII